MDQNNKCNLKCRMCGFSDPRVDSLTAYDMPRELYDSIRRGARFENVIRNIALFQSMRRERGAALPRLRIHHVLSDLNIHAFDSFLDLVEELGPEMIEVRTLADLGQIELRPHAD